MRVFHSNRIVPGQLDSGARNLSNFQNIADFPKFFSFAIFLFLLCVDDGKIFFFVEFDRCGARVNMELSI